MALAESWNRRVRIGDKVRYWETARDIGTDYGYVVASTVTEARVMRAVVAVVGLAGLPDVPVKHCRPLKEIASEQSPRCPKCNSGKQRASGDRAWWCMECGTTWEPVESGFDPTITSNPSRRMEREEARQSGSRDYRRTRR